MIKQKIRDREVIALQLDASSYKKRLVNDVPGEFGRLPRSRRASTLCYRQPLSLSARRAERCFVVSVAVYSTHPIVDFVSRVPVTLCSLSSFPKETMRGTMSKKYMPPPDVIGFVVEAFTESGHAKEAIYLFDRMRAQVETGQSRGSLFGCPQSVVVAMVRFVVVANYLVPDSPIFCVFSLALHILHEVVMFSLSCLFLCARRLCCVVFFCWCFN